MHVSNPSDTTFFIILYLLAVWLGLNICMKIVRLCREIRTSNDYHKMSDASMKTKRKQADCIVWSEAFVWRLRTDFTLNKSSLHSIITQRSPVSSVYLTFFLICLFLTLTRFYLIQSHFVVKCQSQEVLMQYGRIYRSFRRNNWCWLQWRGLFRCRMAYSACIPYSQRMNRGQ